MKTYLEFINEKKLNEGFSKVLELEDLAELVSRLQQGELRDISKKITLERFQDLLKRGGNYAVKREFEKLTDLKVKPIIRGKFQLVYDYDKRIELR